MSNTYNALIRTKQDGTGEEVANNKTGGGSDVSPEVEAMLNVYGSKNLISYPYYETTKTASGLTFTDNGNGTVTIGTNSAQTASADIGFVFKRKGDANFFLANGTYKLSGCPNLSGCDVSLSWSDGTNTHIEQDIGSGAEFTIQGNVVLNGITGSYCGVGCNIASGTTISAGGVIVNPMIRDARITDDTYVPYAKTNRELTETSATQSELSNLVLAGATNTSGATIAAGTCFILNGDFVTAKADIASGATFTLNTNYEKKSVGEVLTEINSKHMVGTGSFANVGYDSYVASLLDNGVDKIISTLSNGYILNLTGSGTAYQGILFKHSDSYYGGILAGYGFRDRIFKFTRQGDWYFMSDIK